MPAAGRPLLAEFCRTLAGWEWDVALLQEVPPWWPEPLAAVCGASARSAVTSRTSLLRARRAIAVRNPDLIAANGGGSNAILVRAAAIADHRVRELTRRPERRIVHGARLGGGAGWVVNAHASLEPPERRRADLALAVATAREWAGEEPLVFGGDLNATRPAFAGLRHVARHHVDHLFVTGHMAVGAGELLDAGELSDHPPLAVTLR